MSKDLPPCFQKYEALKEQYWKQYPHGRIQHRPHKGKVSDVREQRGSWVYTQVTQTRLPADYDCVADPDNHFAYNEEMTQLRWQQTAYLHKGKCGYYPCETPVELGIFHCNVCAAANVLRSSLLTTLLEKGKLDKKTVINLLDYAKESPMYDKIPEQIKNLADSRNTDDDE